MIENLTTKEKKLVIELGKILNEFLTLKVHHLSNSKEFAHAIHNAQCIILSRPAMVSLLFEEKMRIGRNG